MYIKLKNDEKWKAKKKIEKKTQAEELMTKKIYT